MSDPREFYSFYASLYFTICRYSLCYYIGYTPSGSSSSGIPLATGVAAGVVSGIIILCVIALLVFVGLKRRQKQSTDMKGLTNRARDQWLDTMNLQTKL